MPATPPAAIRLLPKPFDINSIPKKPPAPSVKRRLKTAKRRA